MQTEKIYHYTSIDSLALILSSKNIRFARLDTVDDVTEAQTHAGINFGQYFFVSCWTQEETENIAQWKMYGGDMAGIRIELPTYPFRKIKLESVPGFWIDPTSDFKSPLAMSELFGKNYMILPITSIDDGKFGGTVDYVPDVNARYATSITQTAGVPGKTGSSLTVDKMADLPRFKSEIWKFQSEYRFCLHVLPMNPPFDPNGINKPTLEQMASVGSGMQSNIDPGVKYIDVPIDPMALDKMIIRIGPLCTLADRICVEALVEKFAPKAVIEPSHLTDMIRGRGR